MIKIGIDAMGGDFGPEVTCVATKKALEEFKDLDVTLFGNKEEITKYIEESERCHIVHTTKVMNMADKNPLSAIRDNKDSSLSLCFKAGKEGQVDGVLTAGPTQQIVFAATIMLKRLPGIERGALCVLYPSSNENKFHIFLDAGANINIKEDQLLELANIASILAKCLGQSDNPKVGLMNIGVEDNKGRDYDRNLYKLLEEDKRINFVGNVEGKEILTTDTDVLVTDGWTGNMVMKTLEGTASGSGVILKQEIKRSLVSKLGYVLFMKKAMKRYSKRLNPNNVGGPMFLGVTTALVKCHGGANVDAFYASIKQCRLVVKNGFIQEIEKSLD